MNCINTYEPNIIACTHPLSVFVLDYLKRDGIINIPVVSITTDFNPHYTYFAKNLDAYITGSQYSKEKLAQQGIDEDTIYPLGIPVNKNFMKEMYQSPYLLLSQTLTYYLWVVAWDFLVFHLY